MLGAAASPGAPVLYEFLNRYETNLLNTVEESLTFLHTLQTTNVKLLCDFFHMNIEERDIPAALRADQLGVRRLRRHRERRRRALSDGAAAGEQG